MNNFQADQYLFSSIAGGNGKFESNNPHFNNQNINNLSNINFSSSNFGNTNFGTLNNSNSFTKNQIQSPTKHEINSNSFVDIIHDSSRLTIRKSTETLKYSLMDIIAKNNANNSKLNKILCQLSEVDFRLNINCYEEHYVFSIENYLVDTMSIYFYFFIKYIIYKASVFFIIYYTFTQCNKPQIISNL